MNWAKTLFDAQLEPAPKAPKAPKAPPLIDKDNRCSSCGLENVFWSVDVKTGKCDMIYADAAGGHPHYCTHTNLFEVLE